MENRVGWARTYLTKAGLLESPKRGYFQITQAGMEFIRFGQQSLTLEDLEKSKTFREFIGGRITGRNGIWRFTKGSR